jgi:hypothetical protein
LSVWGVPPAFLPVKQQVGPTFLSAGNDRRQVVTPDGTRYSKAAAIKAAASFYNGLW